MRQEIGDARDNFRTVGQLPDSTETWPSEAAPDRALEVFTARD